MVSDCRKVMGEGCTVAVSGVNGSVAIARNPGGNHFYGWGETVSAAKKDVLTQCVTKLACTITHVFTAKPWIEYTDVAGFNELERYRPSGRNIKGRFGTAVLSGSDNSLWIDKVWTSSGHSTAEESQQAARDKCIADSAGQCKSMLTNTDGFIAIYRDEKLNVGLINERNADAARRAVRKLCEDDEVKCTVVDLIDVKRPGFKIVDAAGQR